MRFESLPSPVQRYLRAALTPEQAHIAAVEIETVGSFNTAEEKDSWKPFRARQRAVMHQPGFVWDGTVRLFPGVNMRIHDAYIAGEGALRPSLIGLVDVANMSGAGEIARGELMRFIAEAPWYPTALLPDQGVEWQPVDDYTAIATLQDHGFKVMLTFHFSADGMIASIRSEARGRVVGGQMVPTPWEGRWWDYAAQNGIRVPRHGEVAWILPTGPKSYRRGRVTHASYQFESSEWRMSNLACGVRGCDGARRTVGMLQT